MTAAPPPVAPLTLIIWDALLERCATTKVGERDKVKRLVMVSREDLEAAVAPALLAAASSGAAERAEVAMMEDARAAIEPHLPDDVVDGFTGRVITALQRGAAERARAEALDRFWSNAHARARDAEQRAAAAEALADERHQVGYRDGLAIGEDERARLTAERDAAEAERLRHMLLATCERVGREEAEARVAELEKALAEACDLAELEGFAEVSRLRAVLTDG